MANTSGKQLSVGLRYVAAFALDTAGYPAATSASTPYQGIQFEGSKAFTLTQPEPRQISHSGDDRLLDRDVLPPLEGATAQLKVAKTNDPLDALLSNVLQGYTGEASRIPLMTDQQGFEPQVGLLMFQQSLDSSGAARGQRRWKCYMVPRAVAIPINTGMEENPSEMTYSVTPYVTNAELMGRLLTDVADGATEAQMIRYMTQGKPKLIAYLGDGVEDVFALVGTAVAVAKVTVYVNGVEQTSGITKTTTNVTFTSPPASNANVSIFYEQVA